MGLFEGHGLSPQATLPALYLLALSAPHCNTFPILCGQTPEAAPILTLRAKFTWTHSLPVGALPCKTLDVPRGSLSARATVESLTSLCSWPVLAVELPRPLTSRRGAVALSMRAHHGPHSQMPGSG